MKYKIQNQWMREQGLSLVELMVGLVISLIATLVITATVTTANQQKKNTVGVDDAQTAGTLATFLIERDLRNAGYGLNVKELRGCKVHYYYNELNDDGTSKSTGTYSFIADPVRISPGVDGASDSIYITYGTGDVASFPVAVTSINPVSGTYESFQFPVSDGLVLNPGSVVAFASRSELDCDADGYKDCSIGQITSGLDSRANQNGTENSKGAYYKASLSSSYKDKAGNAVASKFNKADSQRLDVCTAATNDFPNSDSLVIPLGEPVVLEYTVNSSSQLAREKIFPKSIGAQPVVDNVFKLKAQYVFDANADGTIDDIVNPWSTRPSPWNGERVLAIRIAVITRSPVRDGALFPPELEVWGETTLPNGKVIDAVKVNLTDEERHYRYRVYQTIVPMRNFIWSKS